MRIELRDSLEFLYPDTPVSGYPCTSMHLAVARGGTVAVHLLLNDLAEGAELTWTVTENGQPVSEAQWFRLCDVPVEENTGLISFTESTNMGANTVNAPNPHVTRRAPFRVFDAMQPVTDRWTAARATEAFRLHLPIPPLAGPRTLELTIRLQTGGENHALALRVTIYPVTIPPVGRSSFRVTNWHSLPNIAVWHGLAMWSDAHWEMIRRYAELMAHGRQNMFRCQLTDLFDVTPQGPVLNRDRLSRMVQLFTAAGMYYIEGGHFARRKGSAHEADTFTNILDETPSLSSPGNAGIAATARQLMEEIDRYGWRGRWIQHAADEPNAHCAAHYRILCGIIRRHMPGIPLLDAACDRTLFGALDMWCLQAHYYQQHRDFFEEQRQSGDEIWYYTCCEPGGPWLNRLLDQELLRPVLLGWAGLLFHLDGFLHWGLNKWQAGVSPFDRSVVFHDGPWPNGLPAGDTHIVYPGPDGPWSSLRLEAHREGFEDYELLRCLEARNPQAAAAVLQMAVRSFKDYTTDIGTFRRTRSALLEQLSV